jgi:hypothetical protein
MSEIEAMQAMVDTLTTRLAERDKELEAARVELEGFRSRDTDRPPEPPTGKNWTLLEAMDTIVQARKAIDDLAVAFGTSERMALQAYKAVVEEMPVIVKAAVADAVIELVTRQQQTAAKVEDLETWRRRRDRACEDCPNLEAAGV